MRLRRCVTSGAVVLRDKATKVWVNLAEAHKQFGRKSKTALASDALDTVKFIGLSPSTKSAWLDIAAKAAAASSAPSIQPDSNLPLEAKSFRDGALYTRHMEQAMKGFLPLALANGHILQFFFGQLVGKKLRLPNLISGKARKPPYYVGNPLTFVADGEEARWPSHCAWLDYELEVALVLGAPISANPTIEEVESAIEKSAFVLINDFSARDTQADELTSVGFGFVKCKSFCTSVSSDLVTADELWQPGDKGPLFEQGLKTTVTVNGEIWGRGMTSDPLQCSLAEYVQFAALDEGLVPGEVLGLGTVPDCCGLEINKWLKPGDTITVECEGLGRLTNRVGSPRPYAVNFKEIGEDDATRTSRLGTAIKLGAMAIVVPPLACISLLSGALSAIFWKGPTTSPGLSSHKIKAS